MLVAAIDTTARTGSYALVRNGEVLAVASGDPSRPHAARLPAALVDLLTAQRLGLPDVDVFAVAAGPGSFTGLRIGIATIQGLALALNKPAVGISTLDALGQAVLPCLDDARTRLAAWVDAQRGEVFASLYIRHRDPSGARLELADGPLAAPPGEVLARWQERDLSPDVAAGDGAATYSAVLAREAPGITIIEPLPLLAPEVARLAAARVAEGGTWHPHAIAPVYVRRPDAEIARDRRATRA